MGDLATTAFLPNPLGMDSVQYARACKTLGLPGGEREAMNRYAAFFREGVIDATTMAVVVPPVAVVQRSESDEGMVVKFTQRVPRVRPGARAGVDGSIGSATTPSRTSAAGTSLPVLGSAAATSGSATPTMASGDELQIESVLIPMVGKSRVRAYTLCVSSQVGCAMGCTFCQTAQMGLIRSLTAAEIVGQWFAARHMIERPDAEAKIGNIVFMGMGEPMDNLDEVIQAITVLTDSRGPAMAMSKISVSTVGRLDGIEKLAERVKMPGWHRLGLAISLNAPNDEVRSGIMPVNRGMPMARLREALCAWPFYSGKHLCMEYVLIPGVNDSPQHAAQLASFFQGERFAAFAIAPSEWARPEFDATDVAAHVGGPIRGLINVIPYNPRENSPWPAPTEESVDRFMDWLKSFGVFVKRRRTKGRDQMAACGQLGNLAFKRKGMR